MKRFAKSDYGNGEGREPVITQKSGGDMLLGTPIAGAVVGGRVYPRGQAIRLLGGGLAVAALLPNRLARTALAATVTSTYQAAVKKALSDQTDLIEDPEHCSADPDRLKTIGRAIGQQIRIRRSSSRNIVNRLTAGGVGGIQIEQSFSAREGYGRAIADAVAGVYASKLV